jgi:hypothetical protein
MPLSKSLYSFVWSTKNRQPFLESRELRKRESGPNQGKCREYIKNQEEHHQTSGVKEEYNHYLTTSGLESLQIEIGIG